MKNFVILCISITLTFLFITILSLKNDSFDFIKRYVITMNIINLLFALIVLAIVYKYLI